MVLKILLDWTTSTTFDQKWQQQNIIFIKAISFRKRKRQHRAQTQFWVCKIEGFIYLQRWRWLFVHKYIHTYVCTFFLAYGISMYVYPYMVSRLSIRLNEIVAFPTKQNGYFARHLWKIENSNSFNIYVRNVTGNMMFSFYILFIDISIQYSHMYVHMYVVYRALSMFCNQVRWQFNSV